MKKVIIAIVLLCTGMTAMGQGSLTVKKVARNAVRIQYQEQASTDSLPDWLYVKQDETACDLQVETDEAAQTLRIRNREGRLVFHATRHTLEDGGATLAFKLPKGEYLFGLGQFQDGYSNVRGLSRRLTQVNTQISLPMLLSSRGYGILWNNYGLVKWNPADHAVTLQRSDEEGASEVVDVTSTEGGKREVRQRHIFETVISVDEDTDYALLLDVGQKMARRHNLTIDGQTVIEMQNMWLPPTASTIVRLEKGQHKVTAELSRGDQPVLYYNITRDGRLSTVRPSSHVVPVSGGRWWMLLAATISCACR